MTASNVQTQLITLSYHTSTHSTTPYTNLNTYLPTYIIILHVSLHYIAKFEVVRHFLSVSELKQVLEGTGTDD